MYKESITKEVLNNLPLKAFDGKVYVIDSLEKYKKAIPLLKRRKVLGFDTETRPTFKKGKLNEVALLQLSTENEAFLFRINKIGIPDELLEILSSKEILKVGVAIKDDIITLQKIRKFTSGGFIELQKMIKSYGIKEESLKKMTAIVLDFRISKSQQLSNWEKQELKPAQILYAATDAWAAYKIYCKLTNTKEEFFF